MLRSLFTILFLTIALSAQSQVISNVDFPAIERIVKNSASPFYYPKLIERFNNNDTTLTAEEYKFLYYGNATSETYSPYGMSDPEKKLDSLYRIKNFRAAIAAGKETLLENPVNLKTCFRLLVCYDQLGLKDSARIYARKYFGFLNAIYESGDGKSIETAYVVMKVPDEYQVLYDLELESNRQSLIGTTDRLEIDTKSQKKVKGKKKVKELYFNVSKPFESLGKMFNEK
jgi:hypothetical protein